MSEFDDIAETVREIAKRDREIETLRARVEELEETLDTSRDTVESLEIRLVVAQAGLAAVTKERDEYAEKAQLWFEAAGNNGARLAASQVVGQKLREALRAVFITNDPYPTYVAEALALPHDTSALDALQAGLAAMTKERDEIAKKYNDSLIHATNAEQWLQAENARLREALELAIPHINPKAVTGDARTKPLDECYINSICSKALAGESK